MTSINFKLVYSLHLVVYNINFIISQWENWNSAISVQTYFKNVRVKCSLNRLRTHLRKYVFVKNAAKFTKDKRKLLTLYVIRRKEL
jgi:hypothetical protein